MKITAVTLFVLFGLLAGLPLFFSSKAEEAYRAFIEDVRQNDFIQLQGSQYDRTYLSASASTTATINWNEILGKRSNTIDDALRMLGYKVTHEIKHGPFPEIIEGNPRAAQALIVTRLDLADTSKAKLTGLLPKEPPVTFHTWISLTGESKTLINATPFHTRSQLGTLVWRGLSGEMTTTPKQDSIVSELEIPQLSFQSSNGTTYHLRGLKMSSNTNEHESGIRIGNVDFMLDELVIKSSNKKTSDLRIRQLTTQSKVHGTNLQLGSSVSLSVRELSLNGQQFGPAAYDVSVNRLDISLIKQLQQELNAIRTSDLTNQEKRLALTDKASSWLPQFLEHEPELDINRLQFHFDGKQCSVSARARVNANLLTRGAPLLLLLQALDIKADITIPKSLLAAMPTPKPRLALSADNRVMQSQSAPTAIQRMDRLVQQGFFITDGYYYRSGLSYKQGKLLLNGQHFNPLQLAQ